MSLGADVALSRTIKDENTCFCCCMYCIVAATIVNVGLSFLGMFWVLFCGRERELGRVGIIWWELAKMGLFKGKWASREEGSF